MNRKGEDLIKGPLLFVSRYRLPGPDLGVPSEPVFLLDRIVRLALGLDGPLVVIRHVS